MSRPIRALVYPKRLSANIAVLKKLKPEAKLLAVVKANAYGHGLHRVFAGLCQADGLALLDLSDAQRLRFLGWKKPILLLEGSFQETDYILISLLKLDVVIHQFHQLDDLLVSLQRGVDLSSTHIYLKINTGMNRLGLSPAGVLSVFEKLHHWVACQKLASIGLMTHFANADRSCDESPSIDSAAWAHHKLVSVQAQWALLKACQAKIALQGYEPFLSAANSAALLHYPDQAGDIVRPGISLYGAQASHTLTCPVTLLPVMQLESEIIGLQKLQAGDAVGYGSTWVAPVATTIATIACGYADGYPRHAPNGTPVLVNGVMCSLVGRVSMDMLTVDVGRLPDVGIGTPVVLWGDGLPVDQVAKAAGTIAYELLCAVTQRVRFEVVNH